jgi:hypothetical protein
MASGGIEGRVRSLIAQLRASRKKKIEFQLPNNQRCSPTSIAI